MQFTKENGVIIIGLGIVTSILNSIYLNTPKAKFIIRETEHVKVKSIWNYLIDFYPDISILAFVISFNAGLNSILYVVGLILLYRLIMFVVDM